MLTVGFVVTPRFPVMSLAALSVFEFANELTQQQLYDIRIMSEHGGPVATASGMSVDTMELDDLHLDTLIIGGNTQVVPTSAALSAFVRRCAASARRVSSICTGVFALADAGLVEGRRVTTHWMFTDALKQHQAGVRVVENVLFVVDGAIWTAAGNSAGIDLTLRMLEADHGAQLALEVARVLVVDQQRGGRQSQSSALLELNPKSDRIQDVLAYARKNLKGELSVAELARVAALGPRQFSRAFRIETGLTPARAIENLRLEAARLMVEQSQHPVNVIAAETGFGDEERMRRAFLRAYALSPQVLRRKAQQASDAV